ncbi:hypothetical protein RQN30_02345 [Arcanobacterium hippocoleae]
MSGRYLSGDRARKMKLLVLSTYGSRCAKCGHVIDLNVSYPDPMSFSLGHQLPLSKGGSDELANLRPEHRVCNIKAGNRGIKAARRLEGEARFSDPTPDLLSAPW